MTATTYRWSDLETDHPMPTIARQRVIADKMMLSRVRLDAGCFVPTHAHENEQIAVVLSGRIRFVVGHGDRAETVTLAGGEVLVLPADVPHSAEALEETIVLDAFAPPSETTGIDVGR